MVRSPNPKIPVATPTKATSTQRRAWCSQAINSACVIKRPAMGER